jgi:hypothetical protein
MRFFTVALLACLIATPALATDFSVVLKDQDGKILKIRDKDATLGRVCAEALFSPFPNDKEITGEEKFKRGMLGTKLANAGEETLTAEEIALVKKVVGQAYGPFIVVQAWQMLDPGTTPNPVKTETVPAPKAD